MPFQPGQINNPNGGKVAGLFSPWALQAIGTKYLSEYSVEEIKALWRNKRKLGKLPTAHGIVLARLVSALEKNGGAEFDRVMDRMVGKAIQTVNQTNTNVNVNVPDMTTGELTALVREHRGGAIADDSQMVDVTPVISQDVTQEPVAVGVVPQETQATE